MTYDHRAVAGGRKIDPERARTHRLLDEEILPRLERPGRFVEPLRAPRIELAPANAHQPLLLWPSPPESADLSLPAFRLRDALERRCGLSLALAFAPPADLRALLTRETLPPFAISDWTPLVDHPLWLVWLDEAAQLAEAIQVLHAARLPVAPAARAPECPVLLAAGPCVASLASLAAGFADGVLADASIAAAAAALTRLTTLEGESTALRSDSERLSPPSRAADPERLRGALRALIASGAATAGSVEASPSRLRVVLPPVEAQARPVPALGAGNPVMVARASAAAGPSGARGLRPVLAGHLTEPWVDVERARTVIRSWSASAPLRRTLGLIDDAALSAACLAALERGRGQLVFRIAIGLPGESDADRASIPLLTEQLAALCAGAGLGVSVTVAPFVAPADAIQPSAERRPPGGPTAAWHALLQRAGGQAARLLQSGEPMDETAVWLSQLLHGGHAALRSLLETVGARPALEGERAPTFDRGVWEAACGAVGVPCAPEAVTAAATPTPLAEAAAALLHGQNGSGAAAQPTGLESLLAERSRSAHVPSTSPARPAAATPVSPAAPASLAGRGPQWHRWTSLVPRDFEYRVQYEKRGPLRHLNHRELSDALLAACERCGLPLAISGVAKPRLKVTFGPPLPAGVEGCQEFMDLSLTRKTPHLLPLLNEWLPEGIQASAACWVPPGGSCGSLTHLVAAQYEADLPDSSWQTPESAAALGRRIDELLAGAPWPAAPREGIDLKAQVQEIHLRSRHGDGRVLAFTLDLTPAGPKLSALELLSLLLDGHVVDVRTLRVRRTRLLARRPAQPHLLLTPSELIVVAQRELREKVKHCA